MIITVISFKGGVGKSIISQNLAVAFAHAGKSVALIDTDRNQNTNTWGIIRPADTPKVHVSHNDEKNLILKHITKVSAEYDITIIDCPPYSEDVTNRALLKSDFSIVPLTPTGGNDIWATRKFLQHLQLLREQVEKPLDCFFVMNRYEKNELSQSFLDVFPEYEKEYEVKLLDTIIHKRVAYGKANAGGLGALEGNNPKAKNEVKSLVGEIENLYT